MEPRGNEKGPGVATRPEVFGEDASKDTINIALQHSLRKCKNRVPRAFRIETSINMLGENGIRGDSRRWSVGFQRSWPPMWWGIAA